MGLFKNIFGEKKAEAAISINKPSPVFSLPDENGNAVSLSDYSGKRDVMVFIIRGDFCPFCQMMLRTYQKERERFAEKNIMLLSIAPGPIETYHRIVKDMGLEYKVLCDTGLQITKTFGSLDEADKRMYPEGMPVPASFLIDKNGIIRFVSRADKAEEAFNISGIFAALQMLN